MFIQYPPRLIWTIIANLADTNRRDPFAGKNPYALNPNYTAALFQLRRIETTGLITVQRVVIYGSLITGSFPAAGSGAADQHAIARWGGNLATGIGQLRQAKSVDTTAAPISRRRLHLVPVQILVEWNTSAAGDPGATATMEIWGSFIGPSVGGHN